jgi:hypothetical protein
VQFATDDAPRLRSIAAVPTNPEDPERPPGRHLDVRRTWRRDALGTPGGRRSAVIAVIAIVAAAVVAGGLVVVGVLRDRATTTGKAPVGMADRITPSATATRTPTPTTAASATGTTRPTTTPSAQHSTATKPRHALVGPVESSARLPSKDQWLRDVAATLDKAEARDYLTERAGSGEKKLAINLDIDNTVHETYYNGGVIPAMHDLLQYAHSLGYGILFNTGRMDGNRAATLALLQRDGLPVDGLCMRRRGEKLAASKQRCREEYAQDGWALVENIGNMPTDFTGTGYELGVMLPRYGRLM